MLIATAMHIGVMDVVVFAGLPGLLAMLMAYRHARSGTYRPFAGMRPLMWCVVASYPVVLTIFLVRGDQPYKEAILITLFFPILFLLLGLIPAILGYIVFYRIVSRSWLCQRDGEDNRETIRNAGRDTDDLSE